MQCFETRYQIQLVSEVPSVRALRVAHALARYSCTITPLIRSDCRIEVKSILVAQNIRQTRGSDLLTSSQPHIEFKKIHHTKINCSSVPDSIYCRHNFTGGTFWRNTYIILLDFWGKKWIDRFRYVGSFAKKRKVVRYFVGLGLGFRVEHELRFRLGHGLRFSVGHGLVFRVRHELGFRVEHGLGG